ncbi:MAG: hypothetical protein GY754_37955 [bacterium]|nr:hypothetical protein [bacterium]
MKYELREYSFGGCIGYGFNMYFNNLHLFALITLIVQAPLCVVLYYSSPLMMNYNIPDYVFYTVLVFLVMVVQGLASGIIIHVLSRKFLNTNPSAPFYTEKLLPIILPLLGITLIQAIAISVGYAALVVPACILASGWSVAVNVLVIERKGVIESLKRSWELTRERKWKAFGLLMLVSYIYMGILYLLLVPAMIAAETNTDFTFIGPIYLAFASLLYPIMVCPFILFYFNLRIDKEGFNIEHLADQFSLAGAAPVPEELPGE